MYSFFCDIKIFVDKFNSIRQIILIENNFDNNDLILGEKSFIDFNKPNVIFFKFEFILNLYEVI